MSFCWNFDDICHTFGDINTSGLDGHRHIAISGCPLMSHYLWTLTLSLLWSKTLLLCFFVVVLAVKLLPLELQQESMSAPSADMTCGRPFSQLSSVSCSGADSRLGLTVARPSFQSASDPSALDRQPVSKHDASSVWL